MNGYYPAEPAQRAMRRLADHNELSICELAALLGLDRRTVQRTLAKTRLRTDAADHIAVALGHHPSELWPDWFGPVTKEAS